MARGCSNERSPTPNPAATAGAARQGSEKDSAPPTEEEFMAFAKGHCANFRVPRYLRVVADFGAIGMIASGKVHKA
jgi:fatty-acyl-CoA synthase